MKIYYRKNKKHLPSAYHLIDRTKTMYSSTFTIQFSPKEFKLVKNQVEFWTKEQHEVCEVLHEMISADCGVQEAREYLNMLKCYVYEKDVKLRTVIKTKPIKTPSSDWFW